MEKRKKSAFADVYRVDTHKHTILTPEGSSR